MTSRGRYNKIPQDWDPMQEDYNDTMYDPQYADGDINGGVELDHYKLYVKNINKALNEEGLRAAFAKYANNVRVYMSKNPDKRYAIVTFDTPGEAKHAMMKLNKTEPLRLLVSIAHKRKYTHGNQQANNRDDSASGSSRAWSSRKQEDNIGDNSQDFSLDDADMGSELSCSDWKLDLKLKYHRLQAETIECQKLMSQLHSGKKPKISHKPASNRSILPDGRIVVRNNERHPPPTNNMFSSAAGDSITTTCSCDRPWIEPSTSSSTLPPGDSKDKVRYMEEFSVSNVTTSIDRQSEVTKSVVSKDITKISERSNVTKKEKLICNFSYDSGSDDEFDETNRLIQLRNVDYLDIVDDNLKIVIALSGYPKSKMRLKQMELFQKCLNEIIDMQEKAGLLKKPPSFLDYYLNKGAIVCICKDIDSRNWMVRVYPGLQERMHNNLILLKSKIKRSCPAVIKIPKSCWPSTVLDAFKLLQYFNPSLKTHLWKIYAQKTIDDVECTYFIIDRVSGEIIRGPNFKNIIDYKQMEFEINAYNEIYYDCYLSDMAEDLSSVASRVKLLEEIKSNEITPRNVQENDSVASDETCKNIKNDQSDVGMVQSELTFDIGLINEETADINKVLDMTVTMDAGSENVQDINQSGTSCIDDIQYAYDKTETQSEDIDLNEASTSAIAVSDATESLAESNDIINRSNLNIDSSRGMAYHRRTNYLHVENELKIATVLDGYPNNKLEGSHIRRLRHLFKDFLHKDMKAQRFPNLIIPKFQDVYLSNGAVIYICDSLETKDYLTELLPKFINATGLKLTFRSVGNLVRYTRVIMRLSKELAHVESHDILYYFQDKYPNLKPDCWKYYSDIAGKQKRQFGVDPESLEVIKRSDFNPIYEGHRIDFRIIDRKKNFSTEEHQENEEDNDEHVSIEKKVIREKLLKTMYSPIDSEIMNMPLTRIRTNHYSDLIDDDLKLYLGPTNYPESRIDEVLFNLIKKSIENIVFDTCIDDFDPVPVIHDMYLFDGVIFIICLNIASRRWIEKNINIINSKLKVQLKATEFRGAVGIISMIAKTYKNTDEVISILQNQNPRLRTKFWREISKVQTHTKIDVVLQIDKLSAQVISNKDFKGIVDGNKVEFNLGHLQSLLKPKLSLKELTKSHAKKVESPKKCEKFVLTEKVVSDNILKKDDADKTSVTYDKENEENVICGKSNIFLNTIDNKSNKSSIDNDQDYCKVVLKVPTNILPDFNDGLDIIFDLLEDKNPGLNTELWKVESRSQYHRGKFNIVIDRQSASVIKGPRFDPTLGGEKLKFLF